MEQFNRQVVLEWLRDNDMPQTYLARMTGVSYPQIQRILAGKNQPRLPTVARIARVIGRDVGDLVKWSPS